MLIPAIGAKTLSIAEFTVKLRGKCLSAREGWQVAPLDE
jgi:hypothetical protein